jgi:hypothetical protein
LSGNARVYLVLLLAVSGSAALASPVQAEDVKVTVVAVLATSRTDSVDPKLKGIADEVQKIDPTLTGFRIARATGKNLSIGKRETFPLVEDTDVTVLIQQQMGAGKKDKDKDKDKDERYRLAVKAPMVGEITYTTCCTKFFPIMTRYQNRDGDRLIIAIMVEPAKK